MMNDVHRKAYFMPHNKDILWKGLLEWVFDDLLRFVFPDADQVFDFKRGFAFLDKELAQIDLGFNEKTDVRFVDKLVQVCRKNGDEDLLLIHVEVQDQTKAKERPLFAERMFRYFYRCFDRYKKPVIAIAIFCGPDGKKLPNIFKYEFMNTRLQYEYNRLCILDYTDQELGESKNPFAWVILAAKNALLRGKNIDDQLLKGKLFIFRKLYDNGIFEKQKLQAILTFLTRYVRFAKPETNRTFNLEVDKITHKKNSMDIFEQVAEMSREEGVEEGLKKGLKMADEKAVRLFLANTEFSVEKIAQLVGVSVAFVKRMRKEVRAK